jgi:hypothetical protein
MSVISHIFSPFRRAYSAIFRQQVSVSVAKGSVRVVLRDETAAQLRNLEVSRAEISARKQQQEFNLIQQELHQLLDDLPETRATMRHLVFVEQALQRKGLRALHKLPVDVLRRALEQLEGLVVNWSPVGLAALRAKMAVAIIDREHQPSAAEAEADQYRTAAVIDTMPSADFQDGVDVSSDDDALAAAYAALGNVAPTPVAAVAVQGELGSAAARTTAREQARAIGPAAAPIQLRELQN